MKRAAFILLGLVISVNGFAQNQLFESKRAKNQSFQQTIIILDSLGRKLSESSMETTIRVDQATNRLYHLRQTSDGRHDSTVCELSTLKPLYFTSIGRNSISTITYGANTLTAYNKVGEKVLLNSTVKTTHPVYDIFMDTYLVALIPLKVGFTGTFYTFRSDLGREVAFEITDVKNEFLPNATGELTPAYLVLCKNENVSLLCWYQKNTQDLLKVVIQLPNKTNWVRLTQNQPKADVVNPLTNDYEVFNRTIEKIAEKGKDGIRFNEAPKEGLAWLKGVEFSEGVIEFDAKGRDVLQKSFIGIAFHGIDNQTYESVYFRPFNFQSTDPVRKIHAVQYVSAPKFDFQTLRNTRKDEFEAAILPATIQATDWFHARIDVRNNRIRVFVNNSSEPCLDVPSLNPGIKTGKIGFLVGNNSDGSFANLIIRK